MDSFPVGTGRLIDSMFLSLSVTNFLSLSYDFLVPIKLFHKEIAESNGIRALLERIEQAIIPPGLILWLSTKTAPKATVKT